MARKSYEGTARLPGMDEQEAPPSRRNVRRAPQPPRFRISKPRAIAAGIALVVLLGGSLYAFHLTEQFLIRDSRFAIHGSGGPDEDRTVAISGATHASLRAIEAVFAEDMERSLYLVPMQDRLNTLRTVDWVRDAAVARIWPNRLLVSVNERTPVAFVMLPSSRQGLIDAEGVILPLAQDRFDLPVLLGAQVAGTIDERREAVERMTQVTKALGDAAKGVSEIDVSSRDNISISLSHGGRGLKLMLGDRNYAVRYRNFVDHFSEVQARRPDATVLDLRLEDRITVIE